MVNKVDELKKLTQKFYGVCDLYKDCGASDTEPIVAFKWHAERSAREGEVDLPPEWGLYTEVEKSKIKRAEEALTMAATEVYSLLLQATEAERVEYIDSLL